MSISRYDYLNRKTIVVHDEQRRELSEAALTELEQFQVFEFYSQEKMLRISQAKGVQEEIDNLVSSVLAERKKSPEGSNQECMAMDMLTEFISKLDLDDFRKLKIERLIDDEDHKRSL
jgi:hypothetical protein